MLGPEKMFLRPRGAIRLRGVEIRVFESNGRAITVDIREACSNMGRSCVVIQENSIALIRVR